MEQEDPQKPLRSRYDEIVEEKRRKGLLYVHTPEEVEEFENRLMEKLEPLRREIKRRQVEAEIALSKIILTD